MLRVLSKPVVASAIEYMNDGHPLLKPDAVVPPATVKRTLEEFEARMERIEAMLAEAGIALPQEGA